MKNDRWPQIRVKRFYQEPDAEFARRRDEIIFIIEGFRHNRFGSQQAAAMDARLEGLLSGDYDPDAALNVPTLRPVQTSRASSRRPTGTPTLGLVPAPV